MSASFSVEETQGRKAGASKSESIVVTDAKVYVGDPGPLVGASKIVVHTRQGRNLVMGRPPEMEEGSGHKMKFQHIKGIFDYARQVRQVVQSAAMDDPYADWMLVRLETTFKEVEEWIRHTRQEIEAKLSAFRGVDILVAQSVTPIEVTVQFRTPYSYLPLYAISDADQLFLAILTAAHTARISRDQKERLMRDVSAKVRSLLYAPDAWRWGGALVTRGLLQQTDQESLHPKIRKAMADAQQRMGELPQAIMDRSLRGQFAPEIRTKPKFANEDLDDAED